MSLFSAFEDFVHYTFGALPGRWGKLRYQANLRGEDGDYGHWGMSRRHGEKPAQRALARAHQAVFLEVLRTPLRELHDDAVRCAAEQEINKADYIDELEAERQGMLPKNPGGGSKRHFSSVLKALWMLAHSGKDSILPGA